MKDTIHEEIYAVPFKNGKAQKMVLMKKGGQYQFDEDVEYVIEIPAPKLPQMQRGGGVSTDGIDWNAIIQNQMLGNNNQNIQLNPDNPFGFYQTGVDQAQGSMLSMDGDYPVSVPTTGVPTEQDVRNEKRAKDKLSTQEQAASPITQNNVDATKIGEVELPNQSEEAADTDPATGEKIDEKQLSENISNFGNTYGAGAGGQKDTTKNTDDTSKTTVEEEERRKLYNPYATYDTRAAAHTLGRAIDGKESVGTGIAAGAKVGLSLFRDVMSGYGSANRERNIEDIYDERQREGIVGSYPSGQKGGKISYEDVMELRSQTGIDFNEDFAQSYFTKMSPGSETNNGLNEQVNLGRYKDVGYFDVAGKQGDTIMLNTTSRNPHNASTIKQLEKELLDLNPNQKIAVNYTPRKQEGGDITNTQFLEELKRIDQPQNYVSTNPPSAIQPQLPQREEYIRQLLKQYNEGKKTTEEILNEITPKQPINKMQKGGKLSFSERMTGEYEQGLPENKEGQAVVELEKGEHILQPDGTTSEVVGDKHSKGGAKLSPDQIQDGSIVISDHLKIKKDDAKYFKEKYDIKVSTKDTYATVIDKIKKNIGIEKVTQEQEDVFKKIEKEEKNTQDKTTKNLNLEYLSKKVKELEEEKAAIEPQRLEAMKDVYGRQEASKPQEEQAQGEIDPQLLEQLSQESGMPVEQLQEFLKGGKVKKYQEGGFAQFLEAIGGRDKETYTADELQAAKDLNPEEFAKYQEYFDIVEGSKEGDIFRPNEAFFREVESVETATPQERAVQEAAASVPKEEITPFSTEEIVGGNREVLTQEEADRIQKRREVGDPKEEVEERNFPLFPDQGVLPPSSPQLPLKSQIRLGRADSVNISPEAALVEAARQRQAAMGALDTLPPAQRAAMIAMLSTQEGNMANQAINQTAVANAQQDAQTQQFNIGQADREEALEAQNALSYEDRTFRTQAAYRENLNQYYDFLRKVNAQNFQDVRNQNTVNTLMEGYVIDPDGTIRFVGDTKSTVAGSAPQNR